MINEQHLKIVLAAHVLGFGCIHGCVHIICGAVHGAEIWHRNVAL